MKPEGFYRRLGARGSRQVAAKAAFRLVTVARGGA
jgi:hypothetical protein